MYSILNFGARPGVDAPQQAFIQAAIEACAASGGGTVVVPAGTFTTGTLSLRSHVTLHLENGARLVGSTRLEDYPEVAGGFIDAVGQQRNRCLIYACGCESVGLSGPGTIDGQGGKWGFEQDGRPFMLRFIDCRRVQVSGVMLRDSPGWVSHYLGCSDVLIHGVTIHSHVNGNNDGIDIDSCRNVRIAQCNIDTGDDAICLKSTRDTPCENVVATGCVIRSVWGALKLGTESAGDIRNVVFSDIVISETLGGGLKVISMDGSRIENIRVENIVMDRVSGPIFVRLGARLRQYHPGQPKRPVGHLRGLSIRNVRGSVWEEGYKLYGKYPRKAGIIVTGIPGHCIEDLEIENVEFTFPGGGTPADAARVDVPEQETEYPEFPAFHPIPAWGVYLRHARRVRLRDLRFSTLLPDARPLLYTDDVEALQADP